MAPRGASLLLLAPSRGFGGGIERVADAVVAAWPGELTRVDLYRRGRVGVAAGQPAVKAGFGARALSAAVHRKPTIVFALHAGLLPVAHVAASCTGARTAAFAHGIEVWASTPATNRRLIARCDHLVANSSFTADWLARRSLIHRDRIRVVPLPVAEPFAIQASAQHPVPRRLGNFVTVSRLVAENRYKGHFAIAEALPAVLSSRPEARWTVVGGGDDVPRLREAVRRNGVEHAVELRGEVDEAGLLDAYRDAGFLVLPSTADVDAQPPTGEGFGLVYAEAAAFGRPSIASKAGGGSLDFVQDGVTGLTVSPEDPAALASAITSLLESDVERERLGMSARARVNERHLPEHFSAALGAALLEAPAARR